MQFNSKPQIDRSEEVGLFVARLISIIDIGTHREEYNEPGKGIQISHKRKAVFEFELPTEMVALDDGRSFPRKISKFYTQAFGPKTALRKDMEAARGKPYTPSEAEAFDHTILLGKPFHLSIGLNGNGKPKITGFVPLRKSDVVPPQISDTTIFDLDDFSVATFEGLSTFLKGQIELSPEYQAIINPPRYIAPPVQRHAPVASQIDLSDDELGSLPF